MGKIAIPVINGQLNSHFGHTNQFYVYTTENNKIIKEEILIPPAHEPGVFPAWLAELGVTDVIAGGMGQRAIGLFHQSKINVFVGVSIKAPKDLVLDFISGILETSDNVCDH
ncbi:MAG TPA: ATPase [Bacteroidales bacterium]|nr:MAG: ATPase [Bacteroidetes bacterium GWF2_33_38]OFY74795.1 MAG: ATPase [Bacteroidetes bacterium RIFOXYA12_FULL_33_9]OFY89494.1 MAG: ATPase [Bacteroidetes bacterium RIFOXYA2_FULL_33_7]HBF88817.1 ATPase [Bacteroidales bacterium]